MMTMAAPRKGPRISQRVDFTETSEQTFLDGLHTAASAAAGEECPCSRHQHSRRRQRERLGGKIAGRRCAHVLLLLLVTFRQGNAHNDIRGIRRGFLRETRIAVFEGEIEGGDATKNGTTTIRNLSDDNRTLVFAVVPMTTDNPYFSLVKNGCMDQAVRLTDSLDNVTVICEYVGPTSQDADQDRAQLDWVLNLLKNDTVVGIAISVRNESSLQAVLENATITKPIVTFDSDLTKAPHLRRAYVGTNNTLLGKELARNMLQLHPRIGTYAILQSGESPAMIERREGFINELNARKPGWKVLDKSPGDANENVSQALLLLDEFARQDPDCIVSLMGLPMRIVVDETTGSESIPWQAMFNKHVERNITWLCGDAMPHQLELLGSGYVHALIGQMPHAMGRKSIEILFNIHFTGNIGGMNLADGTLTEDAGMVSDSSAQPQGVVVTSVNGESHTDADVEDVTFVSTNVLSHIFVPSQFPENDVDDNLIGNLRAVGYSFFGIIMFTASVLLHWTINYRKVRVVQVAQPKFLGMVIFGVAIMGSTLVPLSMDDGGDPNSLSDLQAIWMCMSVPWLGSIGFTTTFSALYAKTRRINKIFHSKSAFARVKVSEREVMLPFTVLLCCNLAVLAAWTSVDPLTYTREMELGTDGWSRVLSTHGVCRSDNVERYLIPIACLNMGVLVMANWQAFEARHIEAEFSESRYIGVCIGSMLQAAITGVPVLFVVKDNPPAFYLVLVFMIFIIGMVIMLVIFVPKILFARSFMSKTEIEQKDFISFIIQQSSQGKNMGRASNRFPVAYQANTPFASTVPSGYQSQLGISQFAAPDQFEDLFLALETEQERAGDASTKTSDRAVSGQVRTDVIPPMSNITEGSETFDPTTNSRSDTFDISGHNASTPMSDDTVPSVTRRNSERSISSLSLRGLQRVTRPRPTIGLSMRGLMSHQHAPSDSRHHQSHDFGHGSTHHTSMNLDSDDGEDGMLVFRTMSMASDGSIHTFNSHLLHNGSLHIGHLAYDGSRHAAHGHRVYDDHFDDDEAASFYDSHLNASFQTIGTVHSDRTHTSRESNSLQDVALRSRIPTNRNSTRDSRRGAKPNSNGTRKQPTRQPLSDGTSRNKLNISSMIPTLIKETPKPTRVKPRRTVSDPHRTRERLPTVNLMAIKESEDNEGSESSERSLETFLKKGSASSHARLSVSMSDLNCIPENGGASGSDSSSESSISAFEESEQTIDDHNEVNGCTNAEARLAGKRVMEANGIGKVEANPTPDGSLSSFAFDDSDDDMEMAPTKF